MFNTVQPCGTKEQANSDLVQRAFRPVLFLDWNLHPMKDWSESQCQEKTLGKENAIFPTKAPQNQALTEIQTRTPALVTGVLPGKANLLTATPHVAPENEDRLRRGKKDRRVADNWRVKMFQQHCRDWELLKPSPAKWFFKAENIFKRKQNCIQAGWLQRINEKRSPSS